MTDICKPQILVVDDNLSNRQLLARHLLHAGYETTLAETGFQALECIKANKFDLVILDVMMPGMTGLEVLRIIRQTQSVTDLPVILATALGESENVVEGFALGAND